MFQNFMLTEIEPVNRQDKEKFLIVLNSMYQKNPKIKDLIGKLNLEFSYPALGEALNTEQILKSINYKPIKTKKTNGSTSKKTRTKKIY